MSGMPEVFTAEIQRLEREYHVHLLNREVSRIDNPCPNVACRGRGWVKKDETLEICPVCHGHGSEA